ncbi:MAG: ATP-binding protein [Vicinamibacterales bacterium]
MIFADVVGHQHVIGLLAGAVARDTLPPSLIFSGPPRVGKAAVTSALAQLLNCERLSDSERAYAVDACGECQTCRRLAKATELAKKGPGRMAVDCLQWLSPDEKASIKIEPVREVLGRAAFRPFDGRRRLVVIEDAECLEVPAQQALLKMLEEPPSATRFVLLTAKPHALLATIRSRCPQLRFAPLPAREIAQALVGRYGWPSEEAERAAATADGSLGVALDRQRGQGDAERQLTAAVLERVAQSRSAADRLEAAQVFVGKADGPKGAGARKGAVTRQQVLARLDLMAALLRDISALSAMSDSRCVQHVDLAARLQRLVSAFGAERSIRAFEAVDRARTALERNASQKVVADWLALNL